MKQLLDRYRRVLDHLLPRIVVWAAALLAVPLLLAGPVAAGAGLAIAAVVAAVWWRVAWAGADRHLVARAALALAAAVAIARSEGWTWPLLGCLLLLLGALMVEPTVGYATRPALRAHRLPGLALSPAARVPEPLFLGTSAGVALLALGSVGVGVPAALFLAAGALLAGLALACVQLVRGRRHVTETAIRAALVDLAPSYALYYNGTGQGAYQVRMWLPYLERTGERGILVTRDPRFFAEAKRQFGLPVVLARTVEALEYVAVPSLGAFFYVNNDPKNANGVRFAGITHVHLGHGDSDKPASYSPTFAMFDRIFVAGQAAIDRFAQHGVLVPREKFVLVGRPQVEDIEVRDSDAGVERPVVLYAPTWRGGLEDSLFGSLRYGEQIVAALLAAGATVWFRPHPYSARDAESRVQIGRIDALLAADAGRPHAGSTDTAAHTVYECMNVSDAMVTDISSVASDYLYSNKPFAITDTGVVDDIETAYPLARAAVLVPVTGDLATPLAGLVGRDSRRAARAEVRSYYLGDWPPEEYPGVFVAAARAAMTGGTDPIRHSLQ